MSVIGRFKRAFTNIIIKSKAGEVIGLDQAILIFTNPQSGRILEFPVNYFQKADLVYALFPIDEACRKKFEHGAPVKILIKSQTYNAWANLLDVDEVGKIEGLEGTEFLQRLDDMQDGKSRKYCVVKVKIS